MRILKWPHPTLTKVAEPIKIINTDIITLAGNMLYTMKENNGIGLAAPQINKLLQLIVVDTREVDPNGSLEFIINPNILEKEGTNSIVEGCLSFPRDKGVRVVRAAAIRVEFTTLENKKVIKDFRGVTAICVQHEIEHLQGRTLADYENNSINI